MYSTMYSDNKIKEIYNDVIKRIFGEENAEKVANMVAKEERKAEAKSAIEEINDDILQSEAETESIQRTIELLCNLKESEEGRIIEDLCKGNGRYFRKLKSLIKENNRFGIDDMFFDDPPHTCRNGFHIRVFFFDNDEEDIYSTFCYGTGAYDIDNDIRIMKGYLKDCEEERKEYKENLRKYTEELEKLA